MSTELEDFKLQLPFGLPPVLPDVEKQLREYIICPERLPIHDYKNTQVFCSRVANPESLYHADLMPPSSTLKVEREPTSGEIVRYVEVSTDSGGLTARNSLALNRAPLPPEESVRGSASNFPFWPGGFPEPDNLSLPQVQEDEEFLTIPPGFERGFDFDNLELTQMELKAEKSETFNQGLIDLAEILRQDDDLLGQWTDPEVSVTNTQSEDIVIPTGDAISAELDNIVPGEDECRIPLLNISKRTHILSKSATEWAEIIDVASPVTDFEQKVPDMAHKYPFELDPFQKQAIMHLERHEHVFVAAHTSAGKTVVAEYAIALSRKNMTRAIYTSPIKALSNQKYRDFHQTFQDVGLITGDFQLNQTASCLVMTTEILKSMLYCGSDVIRDLQYVIFDEVHYVNDPERGHVWEEVLILLPPHVVIVMLSATVPNTLEFADWVGRTKQRKVYVMSTPKRPVPLEHSLYMGFNLANNRQFVVLDSDGNFRSHAIKEAAQSLVKKEAPSKEAANRGGRGRGAERGGRGGRGGGRTGGPLNASQQKTLWMSLLKDLEKREKLPTVAFTLSRKRCDTNAEMLMSADLLSATEKSHVHRFFQKCLQRLKEEDQKLPQVVRMQALLERGIGIHHSGILPILKEIVELLFQDGYVKFLFATETFAMGVNMPARTVVFDNIRKFDGNEMRYLRPAEYIQMAGRAGRRGLDPTGTVLILCSNEPYAECDLRAMMMGTPTELSSKFRLTYSTMLKLLRVESISVEGIMKQSFREVKHKVRAGDLRLKLDQLLERLQGHQTPSGALVPQLVKFYHAADAWIDKWSSLAPTLVRQAGPMKELVPGRLLVLSNRGYVGQLGLVLTVELKIKGNTEIKALVLKNNAQASQEDAKMPDKWFTMLGMAKTRCDASSEVCAESTVISLSSEQVWMLVRDVTLKIEADKVLKDWEKRQIERFRNDPPWAAFQFAEQELRRVSQGSDLSYHSVLTSQHMEGNISDINHRDQADKVLTLRANVEALASATQVANFEHEFRSVFNHEDLVRNKENIEFMLSNASLSLFPEYQGRLKVLSQLGYVDRHNAVQLKGRVACEMGQHELLLTEMVLAGVLTSLDAAEVAAVFSGLVYQNRKGRNDNTEDNPEEHLTEPLKQAVQSMTEIAERLVKTQRECDVKQDEAENYEESLNFELAEVIYHWARGKPFADIMSMTDVQEGIIVRCIVQLGELLRDVKDAARIIGDPQLQTKMDDAGNAIKRDIVFAASLYTQ